MSTRYTLVAVTLLTVASLCAQRADFERIIPLINKSAKGYLAESSYHTGGYNLSYVYSGRGNRVKITHYELDENLLLVAEDSAELSTDEAREKYTWFQKYRGEQYSVWTVDISKNEAGLLLAKRKLINYRWSWKIGEYIRSVSILEAFKPADDRNLKFKYLAHWDDEAENGDVLVLVSVPFSAENKKHEHYTQFRLIRFNKDMHILDNTLLDMGYGAYYMGGTATFDENDKCSGTRLLFAPFNSGVMEIKPPTQNRYVFIETDEKCAVKSRIQVDITYPKWSVNSVVVDGYDTYFFGSAMGATTDWFSPFDANTSPNTVLQVLKIANGKAQYVSATPLSKMETKIVSAPDAAPAIPYIGKRFVYKGNHVAKNGDLLIYGQLTQQASNGGIQFRDIIAFQFSETGELRAQYNILNKEHNIWASQSGLLQDMINAADGEVYWVVKEVVDVTTEGAETRILTYPRITKINASTAKIGTTVTIGNLPAKPFFLENKESCISENNGKLLFLGSNRSEKLIWMSRIDMN